MVNRSADYASIRTRLREYLDGSGDAMDLFHWLTPICWAEDTESDPSVRTLARDFSLLFAEFTSGHADEEDVRNAVRGALAVDRFDMDLSETPKGVILTAASTAARLSPRRPLRIVGGSSKVLSYGNDEPRLVASLEGCPSHSGSSSDRAYSIAEIS